MPSESISQVKPTLPVRPRVTAMLKNKASELGLSAPKVRVFVSDDVVYAKAGCKTYAVGCVFGPQDVLGYGNTNASMPDAALRRSLVKAITQAVAAVDFQIEAQS